MNKIGEAELRKFGQKINKEQLEAMMNKEEPSWNEIFAAIGGQVVKQGIRSALEDDEIMYIGKRRLGEYMNDQRLKELANNLMAGGAEAMVKKLKEPEIRTELKSLADEVIQPYYDEAKKMVVVGTCTAVAVGFGLGRASRLVNKEKVMGWMKKVVN